MPNTHSTLTSLFTDIADSIRAKTGDTADIIADDFPDAIDAITSGGGGTAEHGVFFLDYDGSVVESWATDEVASKTALPDNPTHTGLVAQGWNWNLQHIKDYIAAYENADVYVGQMYRTSSGLTEIDITVTKVTGLTVTCNMVGDKNWGDGTEDALTSHTYADYGDYTITCDGTSIPAGTTLQGGMFESTSSNMNRFWCTAIRVGENVTSIGQYAFIYCYSLTSITIPQGVTSIGIYAFNTCHALTSATIPQGVTSISQQAFNNCDSLTSITISQGVTSIGAFTFNNCYSLKNATIPQGVTSIGNYAFGSCYHISKYDFTAHTSVPTLGSNAFSTINGICKIVVPDALYDNWIVATNWATYANYIYKASEVSA